VKHNKAAGPDGMPCELCQVFSDLIKGDLKDMLDAFHLGKLEIERLNHSVISLIPKVPEDHLDV
jgi:hypothetical protein